MEANGASLTNAGYANGMFEAVPDAGADFTAFYRSYRELVYAVALRILGNRGDAEDVLQQVFLKLWIAPDGFRGGNVESWLTTVTKNACRDELRRVARERRYVHVANTVPVSNVEDEVLSRTFYGMLAKAFAGLSEEQRTAIYFAVISDQTHATIAARYHLPLGTVKGRIRSGLTVLRRRLILRRIECSGDDYAEDKMRYDIG